MAFIATSSRRQIAVAIMLALAVAGGLIRHYADDPSVLRDVGTLLLVMWLPVVGNLVAWVIRRARAARAKPPPDFAVEFAPHLRVQLEALPVAPGTRGIDPAARRCLLMLGNRGFTARTEGSLMQQLAASETHEAQLEFLHPATALQDLPPGTDFHLVLGITAVAKGRVLSTA